MANTLNLGNGIWGTKENSLLSYNDENGNYKPLPFDFTRASSATVVNKAGLIETVQSGIPRIDFLGNTNGALKLEPQRTNLVLQSESFIGWDIGSSITLTNNSTTSPDGTQNAAKIEYDGGVGYTNFRVQYAAAVGVFSIYAKKGNWRYLGIRNNDGSSHSVWDFDTETFSNVQTNHTMSFDKLGDGWYRISDYVSVDTASAYRGVAITDATGAETNPLAPAGSYVYIWGGQGENSASYPTSYIPTQGSTVTRVVDTCSQTPPSGIIGQTEGTVYWEINVKTTVASGNENILNIDGGSFGNTIYFIKSATGNLIGEMYAASVVQASFTKIAITEGVHKMAIGYANNNTAFFVDGVQIGATDTSCTVPAANRIQLGQGVLGASDCLSNDLKLYNTRLSNSELATLTTL